MNSFPKVIVVLSAMALMTPAPALAESWVLVGDSGEASRYIDIDSINRDNDSAHFRVLSKNYSVSNGVVGHSISYRIMNCYTGQWLKYRNIMFTLNGKVIDDYNYPDEEIKVNSITPGSLGEDIYNSVCR